MFEKHLREPLVFRLLKSECINQKKVMHDIRTTFRNLDTFNKYEFAAICSEFVYLEEDGVKEPHIPCALVAKIHSGFDVYPYLLFYLDDKLKIGYCTLFLDNVSHNIKADMRVAKSQYYCTGTEDF